MHYVTVMYFWSFIYPTSQQPVYPKIRFEVQLELLAAAAAAVESRLATAAACIAMT
jgi:hypothetical protein